MKQGREPGAGGRGGDSAPPGPGGSTPGSRLSAPGSDTPSAPTAIFLMGPTASGKTELAMRLCDRLPCDIVSVDSALVYRGMDIGTAKPDRRTLERYPHRLIDIRDPAEPYSAAAFRRDALAAMSEITAVGRIPLLTGGTMLYFKALLEGLADLPSADAGVRAEIEQRAAEFGWPALHEELAAVDPATAARLHPNHSQRIARALEVYRLTGRPLSAWQAEQASVVLPYRTLQLALVPEDRAWLHERIERRLMRMFNEGFVEEVKLLHQRGDLSTDMPSIRAVGYRQVWEFLSGHLDREAMTRRSLTATRQLAKRQLTWLRRWPDAVRLRPEDGVESMLKRALLAFDAAESRSNEL